MNKLRLRFSKTGKAIYISHLDLMRTMHRSFRRADINLKMTEGFNPRPQTSILMPLSVGQSSICELMDFTPKEDIDPAAALEALNRSFPEGIRATEIYIGGAKVRDLKYFRVNGALEYDDGSGAEKCPLLAQLFLKEELKVFRKTKRGEGEFDILPAVKEISFSPDGGNVKVEAVISAQEPTMNPELITRAIAANAPDLCPDFSEYMRIETYFESMDIFR